MREIQNEQAMRVVVIANKPYAWSPRAAVRIDAHMVCTDIYIRRVCLDIAHSLSDGLIYVLDMAISRIVTLEKVSSHNRSFFAA